MLPVESFTVQFVALFTFKKIKFLLRLQLCRECDIHCFSKKNMSDDVINLHASCVLKIIDFCLIWFTYLFFSLLFISE